MTYVVILALAVWALLQQRRIDRLTRRVDALAARTRALAEDREPLLLDTPLPAMAANDDVARPAIGNVLPWAAGVSLLGLYGAYGCSLARGGFTLALAALTAAALCATLFSALAPPDRRIPYKAMASVALYVSSGLLIWIWPQAAIGAGLGVGAVATVAAFLVLLAAYGGRRRWTHVSALTAVSIANVLGAAAYSRLSADASDETAFASTIGLALVLFIGAAIVQPNRHERGMAAFSGAVGAGILLALAAFSRWQTNWAYAPLLLGIALFVWGALKSSRDSIDPSRDWALFWWTSTASGLALLLAHVLLPPQAAGLGAAGLALVFAAIRGRLHWPALGLAAFASAAVALGHATTSTPETPTAWAIGAPAFTAALLFIAAHESKAHALTHDALRAAGWLAGLVAAFIGIDHLPRLDALLDTAMQALALIAAGHLAAAPNATRAAERWIGPALLTAGFVTALGGAGWTFNPWWGEAPAAVRGIPLLSTLTLAFALPAALALLAAIRWLDAAPRLARWFLAVACAFALLWSVLEVRRSFHVADMVSAPIGWVEGVCYVLIGAVALLGIATQAGRGRIVGFVGRAAGMLQPTISRLQRS